MDKNLFLATSFGFKLNSNLNWRTLILYSLQERLYHSKCLVVTLSFFFRLDLLFFVKIRINPNDSDAAPTNNLVITFNFLLNWRYYQIKDCLKAIELFYHSHYILFLGKIETFLESF